MTMILVERVFTEPQVFEDLQALEDAKGWCLEMHDVTFAYTYYNPDGRRMVCAYLAPDAEAVRRAQRSAELPFERIWPVAAHSVINTPAHDPAIRLALVERTYPAAPSAHQVTELRAATAWCFETNDITPVSLYFEAGGTRGLCVYAAPDLESVRRANALAKLPVDRIWAAELKIPTK